ncbi:MAG: 1-acyl-sn-glycerol-3-phosphate acyltransferase [Acidobacteriota bacterium]|nr:1-acyl-sn-glycerol-3-phosphate acyltransferase [Acidobacteriota bacterium]
MSFLRNLWRAFMVVAMFAYAGAELVVTRPHTRPERAAWLSRFCARVLRALGITYALKGPVPQSGAVISNHLSSLDILLHSAMRPCVFVSKIELRSVPLLGWMSMMSGTVYVARGQGGSASKAAEGMAKGFRDGLPVVFFPEGTTGIGDVPAMPFHSGLLAQSIEAGAPIVPAFIAYALSPRDAAVGKTLSHDVHWGPQSLVHHVWRLLALHGIHATIQFGDAPIAFTEAAIANRKVAAIEAREAVVQLSASPSPKR